MNKELLRRMGVGILSIGLIIKLTSGIFAQEEELLLFQEIPVVISAAKMEQPITEAPAAVTVITAEDIRQSGATNIPDILRQVAGLNVLTITASDQQVSIRSNAAALSGDYLFLIDGRTVYHETLGMIIWDSLTIQLEDIKRVEIIKGPGSALYGENAFNGVINIITMTPEDAKGTQMSAVYGEYNTYRYSLRHAGKRDKLGYLISVGGNGINQWRDKDTSEGEDARARLLLNYDLSDVSRVGVSGGFNIFPDRRKIATSREIGVLEKKDALTYYVQFNYDYDKLKTQIDWKKTSVDTVQLNTLSTNTFVTSLLEAEPRYLMELGDKHLFLFGGQFKYKTIDKGAMVPEDKKQTLWGIFLQDEFRPLETLILTLGARYDDHPLTDPQISPRGSVVYTPIEDHTLRFSYGTAYRNPTFIESYLLQETLQKYSDYNPLLPGSWEIVSSGNENLKPTKVTSYEVGYQTLLVKKIKAKVDLFFNKYRDQIRFGITKLEDHSALFGLPAGTVVVPTKAGYGNGGKTESIGGEIGVDIYFNRWLTGLLNYSYLEVTDTEDDLTTAIDEKDNMRKSAPRNKINAGLRCKLDNGISANILAHYVSDYEYGLRASDTVVGEVPAYTIINVRVGYQFLEDRMEVSLAAFNLLDKKYYEYPEGEVAGFPVGDELGRKLQASLNYKF